MCDKCHFQISRTSGGGAQTGEYYSVCISPLYYENEVRESILNFKFNNATMYTKIYGQLIAECIKEHLAGAYDIITWVPLGKQRLKKRGYDQAMLLAMSTALEFDDVAVELLRKTADVQAQSQIGSFEERKANIEGAYCVADEELVSGKRVLLIDDVVTTGATLSECAKVLKQSGAKDVVCATLAKTKAF